VPTAPGKSQEADLPVRTLASSWVQSVRRRRSAAIRQNFPRSRSSRRNAAPMGTGRPRAAGRRAKISASGQARSAARLLAGRPRGDPDPESRSGSALTLGPDPAPPGSPNRVASAWVLGGCRGTVAFPRMRPRCQTQGKDVAVASRLQRGHD
jgi:hypothetical protein